MKTYFITVIMLLPIISYTQIIYYDCNQKVRVQFLAKKIPKQVCIPKGYQITRVYKKTDINNDGLSDFVFGWSKVNLKDGDTLFVSIYKQAKDSTYHHFKTFNNLKAIYFKSYDYRYKIKDSILMSLKSSYNEQNPPYRLEFIKDTIYISFYIDPYMTLNQYYKYNKDNWYLTREEVWDEYGEFIKKQIHTDFEKVSIDKFNYLFYLD